MSRLKSKQIFLTGSFSGSFSGSFFGDGSGLYNIPSSGIIGLNLSQISSGSVTASVNVGGQGIFLVKSGSYALMEISGSSEANIYSNLFIVKNFDTGKPVLTVSQSIVQFATQSTNPTGLTSAGSIWFTSSSMYVGLE